MINISILKNLTKVTSMLNFNIGKFRVDHVYLFTFYITFLLYFKKSIIVWSQVVVTYSRIQMFFIFYFYVYLLYYVILELIFIPLKTYF